MKANKITPTQRILIPASLTYLAAALTANAELTTFGSRAAFESAVPQSLFTEKFDRFVLDINLRDGQTDVLDGAARISATASFDTTRFRIDSQPSNIPFGELGIDSPDMQGTFVIGSLNSDTDGTLTLEFVPRQGCHHAVGFDFSGATGAREAGVDILTVCRITTQDGGVSTVDFPRDDGFIGFFDPDSPITSITLLDTGTVDPAAEGVPAGGEVFALDNLTVSLADSDTDGMHDFFEDHHGLNKDIDDASDDPDTDLLSNLTESQLATDPNHADTDRDGIPDGIESGDPLHSTNTSPLLTDSDGDGVTDGHEAPDATGWDGIDRGTDPNTADGDGDGVLDGFEIAQRSLPTSNASQPQGLASGLLSHWSFNNNVQDRVGDNHGAEWDMRLPYVSGKFGQAGDFNAVRTAVRMTAGDESEFDFLGSSMSVSLWFRTDGFNPAGGRQTLIAKGNDNNRGWRLRRRPGTNRLTFATGTDDFPDTGLDVADNQWHHIVAVAEAGVSTRLYIDGTLTATGSAPFFADARTRLLIGGEAAGQGFEPETGSKGFIDDVAIWQRPLTEAEIASIWNDGTGASIADLLAARFPLQIESLDYQPATSRTILTWISRHDESYAVDYSTDLVTWHNLADAITSQGAITNLTDHNLPASGSNQRFYRLRPENRS